MRYDKKIRYLELWEKGNRVGSVGFVKLEVWDGCVNIQIKAEKLAGINDGKQLVLLLGKEKELILGEILLQQGRMDANFKEMRYEGIVDDIGYEDLQEVLVRLREDKFLRCIVKEKTVEKEKVEQPEERAEVAILAKRPRAEGQVLQLESELKEKVVPSEKKAKMEKEGQLEEAKISQGREEAEPPKAKTVASPATSKWQQIWERYAHIRPFEDHREYIKLQLEDLVVLTRESYPVISNSFLLHGFYNYNHLILTKENVQGKERYYLGTPGNFFVKEKQVAVLFGFESFEGKEEPAKNSDFGYYMIAVEI